MKYVMYHNLPNGPVLLGRGEIVDNGTLQGVVAVQCDPKYKSDFILGIKLLNQDNADKIEFNSGGLEIRRANEAK